MSWLLSNGQCTCSEDHGLCPLKGIKGINQMYQGLIILASVTLNWSGFD